MRDDDGPAYRYLGDNAGDGHFSSPSGRVTRRASNESYSSAPDPDTQRRGSMSEEEERERRASIKAIMADQSITPLERRRSIQFLMDGRRNSLGGGSQCTVIDDKKLPYSATTTAVPAAGALFGPQRRMSSLEASKRAELSRPHCEHYQRNCSIVAPCCGATFGCRICHDDCPVLPPLLHDYRQKTDTHHQGGGRRKYQRSSSMPTSFSGMSEPQHHTIDRFAVTEVICRFCYLRQSSKTNRCLGCNTQFGEYHCAICNLWMSKEERPYHCPDCGFCRVGGAENFRHCHDCGMCIDKSLFREHNCKVGKYMSNCPVCQEDLFSSRSASHEMPCGHAIHWHCFRDLAAHDSRCPVCKKTAETHERMLPTWNAMAMGIALQPVPPDLAKAVTIVCNDCEKSEENRAWHFLGVQCRHCQSFNTVVERIAMVGPQAHEFLMVADPHPLHLEAQQQQAQQQQQQTNQRRYRRI